VEKTRGGGSPSKDTEQGKPPLKTRNDRTGADRGERRKKLIRDVTRLPDFDGDTYKVNSLPDHRRLGLDLVVTRITIFYNIHPVVLTPARKDLRKSPFCPTIQMLKTNKALPEERPT